MSSSPSSVPELESSPPPPPLSAPSFNHFNFLNPSQSSSEKFISSSSTLHSDSFFMPAPPTLSSPFVPTIHDPFYSSNKNEIPMPNSYGSSKFEPTLPSLFPVVKEGSSASSSHPNFQFSSFFYDSTNELSHQLSTVQLGHHRNSKKDMLGVHINLNLNAIADNKLPSPSMNSIPYSSSPSSSLLPTKQNSNVYVPSPLNPTTNESTMHTNASFSHPNLNNPQLSSPDQIPRHKTYFNKFTKQSIYPIDSALRNRESSFLKHSWSNQKLSQNDRSIVVLWDTFCKGSYPHDLLLRIYQKFLQTWSSTCENVSFSIVCTSPRYIMECFPLPSFEIRWIEASDVAMVTEVLRLSVAKLEHLIVISENHCLISALKHLVENGRMHVDWISLAQPCSQTLPFVTFVPMDQFLKPFSLIHHRRITEINSFRSLITPPSYPHDGKFKLLSKMVPIAPPPSTNHISLAWVSFGPLYHALQHPSIRERLGPQYELPIDLSLLGGILKTAMEPFASLKFYLQAAQELGLVKLLHHGSRCLLKVSNSERLQLWANTNPNSTLISSNMNSTNNTSGNGVNTNSFQNTSSINTPSIRLPQRSLTERELAPFLPLLHAFCLARMRYPPPIRTPAIGPLLKPLFAQNQLPWKKLSEYLTEAERQGVVRLNKLGVNGDVQIWICEHVCGEVWQRLKHRHGPFREASSEPTTNPLDSKEYANGGANLNPSEGTSSHLPLNYPNLHWEMAAHANGNPPSMSSPKLTTGSFVKPIASNLSASKDHVDTTMVNNIAKLWDQNVTFSPQAPSSTFPPEKNDVTSDSFSLAFPFSYTPWGAANKSNPSTDHFINKQNPTHFLNIPIKCPSPVDSLKAQPQGNVYYTPWSTPSFLHLECEKSTAL